MKKLNIGCGKDIKKGYINLDIVPHKGVDAVHNLNKFPYPFEDSTFDEIVMIEVLEHLDDTIKIIKELYRILKPDGKLIIEVPYYLSRHAWSHPEHTRGFNYYTFLHFIEGNPISETTKYFGFLFKTGKIKILYGRGKKVTNYILEPLANLSPTLYENTILRMLFPADGIRAELIKGEK